MGDLIKYEENGIEILIEQSDEADAGDQMILCGGVEKNVKKAVKSLDESLSKLNYISSKIINNIKDSKASKIPDVVNVEFGIKLGGEADFIVAKGSAEANFKVSLTWNK